MIICFRIFVGLQHEFMVFDILISNLFFFSNLRCFYIKVAQFRLWKCNAPFFLKSHIYTFDDKDAPHWQRKWSSSVRLYLSCRKFFNGFVMFDLRSFGCCKNNFLSFRCTKSVKTDKSTISFYTNIIQIYAQRCRQIILCRCCCKLLTMLMYV